MSDSLFYYSLALSEPGARLGPRKASVILLSPCSPQCWGHGHNHRALGIQTQVLRPAQYVLLRTEPDRQSNLSVQHILCRGITSPAISVYLCFLGLNGS